jgi:hypothetical protein
MVLSGKMIINVAKYLIFFSAPHPSFLAPSSFADSLEKTAKRMARRKGK